ncbi:MAG: hypothetical protein IPJ03_20570 [Ignavibacteriales bacterium]|nr:hypothetical protein [Ignavibacteriales bacterium]
MKLIKSASLFTAVIIFSFVVSGCLTTQYKEYSYKVNKDGSGSGKILFYNIVSQLDDGKNVSFKDFGELVDDYLNGTRFEDDNLKLKVTDKKLFEKDGMLMGEVAFNFESLDSIGFFITKNCDCSPIMYHLSNYNETFIESNGKWLGADGNFPVIVWEDGSRELKFKTAAQEDVTEANSLLPMWKTYKETAK